MGFLRSRIYAIKFLPSRSFELSSPTSVSEKGTESGCNPIIIVRRSAGMFSWWIARFVLSFSVSRKNIPKRSKGGHKIDLSVYPAVVFGVRSTKEEVLVLVVDYEGVPFFTTTAATKLLL